MHYQRMRAAAQTGDVLMVKGTGFWAWFVRIVTGETVSHVAMLVWVADGLWVIEMHERHGCRMMPASQWVPLALKRARVFFGQAPAIVRACDGTVKRKAFEYRGAGYAWWELPLVWAGRVLGLRRTAGRVCSTMVQAAWEAAGKQFSAPADPGDYLHLCQRVEPLGAQ